MNREGFVPPSANNMAAAAAGSASMKGLGVKYNCSNCSVSFSLNKNDPVRCKECGHRVLFKARTKRMVQFEAR